MDIEKVKAHLRVSHSLEDGLIGQYIEWASDTITQAVFDKYDTNLNISLLEQDTAYQRAVVLLTTYYYENRLSISEVNQHDNPYGVLHAIQTLRGNRHHFLGDKNET